MYDSSSERRSIRSRALRACRTGRTSPRLLGLRQYLQSLAASRPDAYKRVVTVTREQKADDHAKMISIALPAFWMDWRPTGARGRLRRSIWLATEAAGPRATISTTGSTNGFSSARSPGAARVSTTTPRRRSFSKTALWQACSKLIRALALTILEDRSPWVTAGGAFWAGTATKSCRTGVFSPAVLPTTRIIRRCTPSMSRRRGRAWASMVQGFPLARYEHQSGQPGRL